MKGGKAKQGAMSEEVLALAQSHRKLRSIYYIPGFVPPGGRGTPVSHWPLAAVLGVWVGDCVSGGGNVTQQRYPLSFSLLSACLNQESFGHI